MHNRTLKCKESSKTLRLWKWLWWHFLSRTYTPVTVSFIGRNWCTKNDRLAFFFFFWKSTFLGWPHHYRSILGTACSLPTKGHCRAAKFTLISTHPEMQKDTDACLSEGSFFYTLDKILWDSCSSQMTPRDDCFFLMSTVSCQLKCFFLLLSPVNFHLCHTIQLKYHFIRGFPCPHPAS